MFPIVSFNKRKKKKRVLEKFTSTREKIMMLTSLKISVKGTRHDGYGENEERLLTHF